MVFRCGRGSYTYLPQSLRRCISQPAHVFDTRAYLLFATDADLVLDGDGMRWFDSRERSHGDCLRQDGGQRNSPVDSRRYWM